MAVSLVASAVAIGITLVIGTRIRQQDETPTHQPQATGVRPLPLAA